MASSEVRLNVTIENLRAVRALLKAAMAIDRIVDEQPWNDDAKYAKRALRFARRHLTTTIRKKDGPCKG